ncbi:MAG: MMPL family transporter [Solirubrobacterales bacterium]
MRAGERFGALAAWAARHSRVVLAVALVLAAGAGLGASRLHTEAGADTLVDTGSESYRATELVRRHFGEDPVVVLARGDLRNLLLTPNLGQLLRLEGCLAGNPPQGAKPIPGPCAEIARLRPVEFLSGPATFLNQAVIGIDRQLGRRLAIARRRARRTAFAVAARARAQGLSRAEAQTLGGQAAVAVMQEFQRSLLSAAARYGITSLPKLTDRAFVSRVVFDLRQTGGTPKAKLAYLFPDRNAAEIVIRLRPDLTASERHRAIGLIDRAVHDTTPRKACADGRRPAPCFALDGGSYVVSGAPVVVDGLAGILREALLVLFAVAVAVMALTLLAVFRSRMRLLPLAVALAAAAITFGLFGALGGSLTMGSIAVLPVLIGLAVDYSIQFQARFGEALAGGAGGGRAVRLAATRGGPVIGTACLATAAGFAVLQLSPSPMVRGFGLMLVVGIAVAFGLALTAGFAALSLGGARPGRAGGEGERAGRAGAEGRRAGGAGSPPGRPAVQDGPRPARGGLRTAERFWQRAVAVCVAAPGRVLAIGLLLAACGWVAGTRIGTVSDVRKLVPADLSAVRSLNQLQRATGVSGELDVAIRSDDPTDPALISWMGDFKRRVLAGNGFGGRFASCRGAQICPGPALSDFLGSPPQASRAEVRELIAALPSYDLRAVLSPATGGGRIGNVALISFGIRAQSLEGQQALIDRVRSEVDPPGPGNGPPAGTEVHLAGLPVLAAESATGISRSRYWLTLAGIVAVALVLLGVYRSASRALAPLVPIVLATGWSSLILAAMGIPLNPMSAALGVLVIAIGTEFSVILAARYHEERRGGNSPGEALRRAYSRTGAAVLASGITAIAGFAVLIASDIRMLRDFGLVTVVDLTVALAGVMLLLPAALVWAESGFEVSGVPLPRRLAALRPGAARR